MFHFGLLYGLYIVKFFPHSLIPETVGLDSCSRGRSRRHMATPARIEVERILTIRFPSAESCRTRVYVDSPKSMKASQLRSGRAKESSFES